MKGETWAEQWARSERKIDRYLKVLRVLIWLQVAAATIQVVALILRMAQ